MGNTTYFSGYFPVSHQHSTHPLNSGLTPQDEDGSQCPGVTVLTGPSSYDLYEVNIDLLLVPKQNTEL